MRKKKRNLVTKILQFFDTRNIERPCLNCPCGEGAMLRYIKQSIKETDGIRLHYERCNVCGFEFYAHNENNIKEINTLYRRFLSPRGDIGNLIEGKTSIERLFVSG